MAYQRLARILNVFADCRPEEARSVLLMFAYSMLLGIASVFYETAANALFLSQGDAGAHGGGHEGAHEGEAQNLPYVYLGATLITAAAAGLFTRMESRVSLTRLLTGAQACLVLAVVAFRIGLMFAPDNPALIMLVRIWWEVMWMMGELVFWTLAGSLFNLQQGKRLFALVGSGELLTEILGGASMAWISQWFPVADMLWVCVAAMAGCTVMPVLALRGRGGGHGAASAAATGSAEHTGHKTIVVDLGHAERGGSRLTIREMLGNRYMALILAMSSVNMAVWYFLDYAFYQQVETAYDNPQELAAFLGLFAAIVGVVNLITKAMLAGWILTRFGVRTGLLSLPAALGIGTAAVMFAGMGMGPGAIFWPMVVCKLLEKVLNNSLHEPAARILYQPVPADRRVTLQAVVEGMIAPLTAGATGAALLFLTWYIKDFDALKASVVLMGLLALLIVLTFSLSARYGEALAKSLARRSLDVDALSLDDGSSKKILERYLQSSDEMEVIYALNLMGDRTDAGLGKLLVGLLNHPSATVRQEALDRIERLKPAGARGPVERLIREDPAPAVAGAAVRTLIALGENDVLDRVTVFLNDPRPELRKGAMVGLLRDGGIEGVLAAGEHLVALVRSAVPADRAMAADVLGRVGIRSFYRALLGLLADPDPAVRRSALAAAGHVANPALWPLVVAALTAPMLRTTACSALAAGGVSALPAIEAAMQLPGYGTIERVLLVRTVRRIGGPEAIALLGKHMDQADGAVRRDALLALGQLGYDVDAHEERAYVVGMVQRESGRAAWLLAGLEDVRDADAPALTRALNIEVKRSVDTIFLLLGLLYPSPAIRDARIHLDGDSPEKRALAVEIVDQFLTRELKDLVFPLVEDLPRAERLVRLAFAHPRKRMDAGGRLREILEAGWLSSWTRSCALYHMAGRGAGELREAVERAAKQPDRLVAETAAWARTRLAGAGA